MFSSDQSNVSSSTAASVQETAELLHETFQVKNNEINGFAKIYSNSFDLFFPRIENSLTKSENTMANMSQMLQRTTIQINKITQKRQQQQLKRDESENS